MLPYTAYLRLYQPLVAFSSREREYWQVYANSPHRRGRTEAMTAEHGERLAVLLSDPPLAAPLAESGEAYVRQVGDELFVCPWQVRLRSWIAFSTFRTATPRRLRRAFLPDLVVQETERDFARWRDRTGRTQSQILTSAWEVPPAWFVPFDAGGRRLALGRSDDACSGEEPVRPPHAVGACPRCGHAPTAPEHAPPRTLLYVTEVAQARPRLARAIRLVSGFFPAGSSFLYGLERLEDWMNALAHPRALLELDYGGLVHLLDDAALRSDHSVAEIHTALTALEQERPELVTAMRMRLRERWDAVRALRHAN
ncbi:hypothetical protein NI17_016815 [Thermobifida halotolerans]|uniref:DUF8083 domain-containing protein n=1 Tax=Thermobifida halotolerans TaxID=483545 RepID=A0A399FZZ9_9ACTN|nr:hypothetical protein NI17_016815 [Thermobifida halotolerans]